MTQLCNLNHTHKHGGANCYDIGKCRCTPCRTGNSTRTRQRRRLKAYGRWEGLIPAIGTQRRIQGLQVLGFTFDQIGAAAGFNRNTVWRVLNEDTVEARTRDRITAAHKALLRTPTAGASPRTARQSKAKGYVSPFAWDDDQIDDPNASPVTTERDRILKGDDLMHEIDHLLSLGESANQIARALNKTPDNLERFAWRHNRSDIASLFTQAAKKEAA
jgi:hypothetical protein